MRERKEVASSYTESVELLGFFGVNVEGLGSDRPFGFQIGGQRGVRKFTDHLFGAAAGQQDAQCRKGKENLFQHFLLHYLKNCFHITLFGIQLHHKFL